MDTITTNEMTAETHMITGDGKRITNMAAIRCKCGHTLAEHGYDDTSPDDVRTNCYIGDCDCEAYTPYCPLKDDLTSSPFDTAYYNVLGAQKSIKKAFSDKLGW